MRRKSCSAALFAAATVFYGLSPVTAAQAESTEKAVQCLAEAIYFEARGESSRGQMLVGQVILNRVESSRFPDSVCGVVYQNAARRNACQFSFACDGLPETITEQQAWRAAKAQSEELLGCDEPCRDEKGWSDGLWSATHYHADYVQPGWAAKLQHTGKIGTHLFYVEGVS